MKRRHFDQLIFNGINMYNHYLRGLFVVVIIPLLYQTYVVPLSLQNEMYPKQRLFDHLMKNYNRFLRPVKKEEEITEVSMELGLTFINNLDEKQQILHTHIWIRCRWYDEFLKWDPGEYGNITFLVLPSTLIWIPDIAFVNEVHGMYNEDFYRFNARLRFDSEVRWSPGGEASFNCPMDVSLFPLDTQACVLKFESWMYNTSEILFKTENPRFTHVRSSRHGIWEIVSFRSESQVNNYHTGNYSMQEFHFTFKRKPMYYVVYIVIPCLTLGVLNLFLFIIPPMSGEKVSLGMTIILAYFVFLLLVAEKLPEMSDNIPLFVIYLTSVIVLSAVSLMCSICVVYLHNNHPKRNVPKWIKRIIALCRGNSQKNSENVKGML